MGKTGRKIPQITLLDVADCWPTLCIQNGNTAVAVDHYSPFCLLMPVQFANAADTKAHIYAGNSFRDSEVALCHLPGPSAGLHTFMSIVERGPKKIHSSYVCCGRILERWKLRGKRRIFRARLTESFRRSINPAFRWSIRVAENTSALCCGACYGHRTAGSGTNG